MVGAIAVKVTVAGSTKGDVTGAAVVKAGITGAAPAISIELSVELDGGQNWITDAMNRSTVAVGRCRWRDCRWSGERGIDSAQSFAKFANLLNQDSRKRCWRRTGRQKQGHLG